MVKLINACVSKCTVNAESLLCRCFSANLVAMQYLFVCWELNSLSFYCCLINLFKEKKSILDVRKPDNIFNMYMTALTANMPVHISNYILANLTPALLTLGFMSATYFC